MAPRILTQEEAAAVFQGEINDAKHRHENAVDVIPSGNQAGVDLALDLDAYAQLKKLTTGELQLKDLILNPNSPDCNLKLRRYVRIARGEEKAPANSNKRFLKALQTLGNVMKEQKKQKNQN